MRKSLAAIGFCLALAFPFISFAGPNPPPGVTTSGAVTAAHCAKFNSATVISDSGGACGGSGSPGGTSGQEQYNNSGAFGGFTMSGDCTDVTSTGVITCTKLNSVSPGGFFSASPASPPVIGNTVAANGTFATLGASAFTDTALSSGSTQCVQANTAGTLSLTGTSCGSGAGTITQVVAGSLLTGGGTSGSVTVGVATIVANTALVNATASAAVPTAIALPSCSTVNSYLQYTTSTGFSCLTATVPTAVFVQSETSGGASPDSCVAATLCGRNITGTTVNTITGASFSGLTFTLPAGTYIIEGTSVYNDGTSTDAKVSLLRNTTDSTNTIIGLLLSHSNVANLPATINGVFTIAASKTFAWQIETTSGWSGGTANSFAGITETYVIIVVTKIG